MARNAASIFTTLPMVSRPPHQSQAHSSGPVSVYAVVISVQAPPGGSAVGA
ncbi:hypothetical protein ABT369_01550 [Dactylosporangium sp. NPDC000244]|uniref:hypothetical protein n=1 Tax=Dactylosporangium sp. NPDC000244 TaxID=3154365 RepID=UPI0033178741